MKAGDVLFALVLGVSQAVGVSFSDGGFSASAALCAVSAIAASLLTAHRIRSAVHGEEAK